MIREFFIAIGFTIIIVFIVTGILVGLEVGIYYLSKGTYEYVDLNNKKGIAENCYIDDGYSNCYKEDGTVIKVKEFRKVEE